ncbi:MAG: calcium-binding protein [Shinella sp.]|jgi:hypothetical protein|nr:MAG: calcium-binding protein [Shinella sp.]
MTHPDIDAPSLKRLEADHMALLALCLRLEEAAESFETSGIGQDIAALAAELTPFLSAAQELEEARFFPDFDRHAGSCFGAMLIEQLKAEHRYDRFAAQELSQTLKALMEQRCPLPLATVTAMMRGFAETLRRHLHAETLMIETLLAAKAEGREIFA